MKSVLVFFLIPNKQCALLSHCDRQRRSLLLTMTATFSRARLSLLSLKTVNKKIIVLAPRQHCKSPSPSFLASYIQGFTNTWTKEASRWCHCGRWSINFVKQSQQQVWFSTSWFNGKIAKCCCGCCSVFIQSILLTLAFKPCMYIGSE